jgi:hypothetical protein
MKDRRAVVRHIQKRREGVLYVRIEIPHGYLRRGTEILSGNPVDIGHKNG